MTSTIFAKNSRSTARDPDAHAARVYPHPFHTLTREAILAGLNSGDFYASTGVTLKDIQATAESLTVEMEEYRWRRQSQRLRCEWRIGISNQNPASYKFRKQRACVRISMAMIVQ